MARSRNSNKGLLLLLIIVLTAAAAVTFGVFQFRTDTFTTSLKERKPVVILFLVTEQDRLVYLDLFLYHPGTKKGSLFYIPSNLGSRIETLDRYDKIDVLYDSDDLTLLRKKLEQIIDLPISFYIDLSLANVGKLVDLVGGLELFISNPVDINSDRGKVLLPSGSVLIDGDKIISFITYEQEGEEEREKVARKQKFLASLLKKIGNPAVSALLLEKQTFGFLKKFLKTNLNTRALQSLIVELSRLKADRLLFQRVLGSLKKIEGIEEPVLFPHYEGNLVKQTIKQSLETLASDDPQFDDAMTINVEILNGTSIDGLAKRTKALYESFGFEVVSFRNADNDEYLETVVLDRKGKAHLAERVAEVIQCQKIFTKLDPDLNADITLILGKDFDGRYCKN